MQYVSIGFNRRIVTCLDFEKQRELRTYVRLSFSQGRFAYEATKSCVLWRPVLEIELNAFQWTDRTYAMASCGNRHQYGGARKMEVWMIGSVTRLTGSICIRFNPLDKLLLHYAPHVHLLAPSSARFTLVQKRHYHWRRQEGRFWLWRGH